MMAVIPACRSLATRPLVRYATSSTLLQGSQQKEEPASSFKFKSKAKSPVDPTKLYRADRVLANRGWGPRSDCTRILKQKRVFQKRGSELRMIMGPSEKIKMSAPLFVDEKIEVPAPPPPLRVFYKPKWTLSVMNDPRGRNCLEGLEVTEDGRMHPVGRLDYDSSGLLLFSSNGRLTQKLLHPNNQIDKEYEALVVGSVEESELRQKLEAGVETSMGSFTGELLEVTPVPEDQVPTTISNILETLPPEYDMDRLESKGSLFFKDAKELSEVRLVVKEGKHRMVRRMLANCGHPVIGLRRERMGEIRLKDLKEGDHRELTHREERWVASIMNAKIDDKPEKEPYVSKALRKRRQKRDG